MERKHPKTKRFILTGTPGSGKTSVILELKTLGHSVVSEAATSVIDTQQANHILKPWENPSFIDDITQLQKHRQIDAKGSLQFYDRSPFCTYALSKYLNYEAPSTLLAEITRCLELQIYQNKIFFFENLGFIENTEARKISYEEALVFEKIHLDVYKEFGFDFILVPKNSIKERCNFIIDYATQE
ncbi:MAG: hypothetical protein K0R73_180 [Candidatus Midichloriaceae bacterium]|jgi:predicted ATPase|nr:hypothetical protein [Candidatus Midichloriaceae bacterium]